jgi:protein-tyrosine phosphatase
VVADYAATGERTEAVLARLRRSPTYASDIDRRPASSHHPRPETMTAFLEQMDTRYGGVTAWLYGRGFGAADQRRLHAKLHAA